MKSHLFTGLDDGKKRAIILRLIRGRLFLLCFTLTKKMLPPDRVQDSGWIWEMPPALASPAPIRDPKNPELLDS